MTKKPWEAYIKKDRDYSDDIYDSKDFEDYACREDYMHVREVISHTEDWYDFRNALITIRNYMSPTKAIVEFIDHTLELKK